MKKINIFFSEKIKFPELVTRLISNNIIGLNNPNMMLTGGNSIKSVYRYWNKNNYWGDKIHSFFFTDERCVSPNDILSNYNMTMQTLFINCDTSNIKINRINGATENIADECIRYENIIKSGIDIILLSVGNDGHIASIFPKSELVKEKNKYVSYDKDINNLLRITITPKMLDFCKYKYLIVIGKEKGKVLLKALENIEDYHSYPVNLLNNVNWVFDQEAISVLDTSKIKYNNVKLSIYNV